MPKHRKKTEPPRKTVAPTKGGREGVIKRTASEEAIRRGYDKVTKR